MIMANPLRILSAFSRITARFVAIDRGSNLASKPVIYAKHETFIVEQAKPSDAGRIVDFLMNVFTFTEPHCRALGMTPEESKPLMMMMTEKCLPYGLSCLVFESRSKQLAGVRLFGVAGRDDPAEEPIQLPQKAQIIATLLDDTKKGFWMKVDRNVHRVITREITSVSKQHMRKGIATFLLSHLIDEPNVRRLDVQGIISEASSIENQRLLRKAGYEIYNEIKHEEYLDKNGHRIFNCDNGTDRIILFFKKL